MPVKHSPNQLECYLVYSNYGSLSSLGSDIAAEFNGSFSTEHGVGQLKKHDLMYYKSKIELQLMKIIKKAIDPNDIMNPNKIL